MGVVAPYVRKAWTRDLTASCEGMSIMITHTAAAVVTRHCSDLTVVGGAAATFSVGGSRPKVLAWSAGGNLTQFDADAYVLARTAEEITHTYTDKVPPDCILGAPKRLPLILTYYALAFPSFDLGHLLKSRFSNVVARSYDRACSRNCMPEYKLIQKKKKKKKKKPLRDHEMLPFY
jgi:hypothetical protein